MLNDKRQHRRINKNLNLRFCVVGTSPQKWDISAIENVSIGGVRFVAPSDLSLNNKILHLQIRLPELAPLILELDAKVVDIKPRFGGKQSDVRVKFINISDDNKKHLAIIEKIIDLQEIKNAKK